MANRLEQNDVLLTGTGEIAVNFASNNNVYSNIVKPNKQNTVISADPVGGLKNVFDRQVYHPNGSKPTPNILIFNWGNQTYIGLSAFQKATRQELYASIITSKRAYF